MKKMVIDDIALLAETDIKNKPLIAKRKSMLSQLQGQLGKMEEALKDKDGTIETLERQLVQAGIKVKVMQAEMEITKKKEEVKSDLEDSKTKLESGVKEAVDNFKDKATVEGTRLQMAVENAKKDLQRNEKGE